MSRWMTAMLLAGAAVLSGCATAPQPPVAMNTKAMFNPQVRIGVAMAVIPKVDTFFPGADCLLCYAAASVANSSLTAAAKDLPVDDLSAVKSEIAEALKKKGAQVVLIDEAINLEKFPELERKPNRADRDFSRLRDAHKIDKLVLVNVQSIGFRRNYASYIPTSDPQAWVNAKGYVVDLSTHVLDWWEPVDVVASARGKWDEPPKYPGLTNAYYQAVEKAKDKLLKPLQ